MTEKKDIREKVKSLWIRGMKAVGNTAANIANNTRYKVDEVTIQNRRREVLGDLANKAYSLWLKGEKFPEQMTRMLSELQQLDDQLNDMRAEKYASSKKASVSEPADSTSDPEPDDDAAAADADGTAASAADDEDDGAEDVGQPIDEVLIPVSTEINGLFDESSSVGKMAEKVNSSLEQMSDRIKRFPVNGDPDKKEEKRQE